MQAPVIETARLRLRGHTREDFTHCAALWSDPEVVRYIGGTPQTGEEVWARLLRYAGLWALLGFGYWVVEEKATGAFLGETGFADFQREIEPPLGATPEAGWVFATSAQGKGYAYEAVQKVHAWGREHFQTVQSACLIHPENAASLRLAAKVGYRETLRTAFRAKPVLILHRNWQIE